MASQVDSSLKCYPLRMHSAQQYENYGDLMVSSQGTQEIKIGDVVEIATEKCNGPILLKVSSTGESGKVKGVDGVSILDTICSNNHFSFKAFDQISLKKVKPEPVDLVVLTCKDTYLSRSDKWRLQQHLEGTCVYLDKRVNFLAMKTPLTVSEIWSKGERLTCGYISKTTKICFRSSTAAVHLFLQMSTEMWQYDNYGDLYFEKAVGGFLNELFKYWKDADCCHDVTIVMFSRTFYEAKSMDEFPEFMREALAKDINGRFYEDFYRVVIQNERYEAWENTLIKLKKLFINYENKVLRNEERKLYPTIPKAFNSSAAQGNLLEVLNFSLNVYEKYYLDRNFDRLGKTCMVITPGPGVFEVEKDLMFVTKYRTIDTGCAADLICMGEQPLHAVPLFKFAKKKNELLNRSDYKIPKSWLNHSFYTSQSQVRSTSTSQFVPRIKKASMKSKQEMIEDSEEVIRVFSDISEVDELQDNSDYDAYDREIFKPPARVRFRSLTHLGPRKVGGAGQEALGTRLLQSRHLSEEDKSQELVSTSSDQKKGGQSKSFGASSSRIYESSVEREQKVPFTRDSGGSSDEETEVIVGSSEKLDKFDSNSSKVPGKRIDPFAPVPVKQRSSANQRRWVHAFPTGLNGLAIQPHHYIDDQRLTLSSHKLVISGSDRVKVTKRFSTDVTARRFISLTSFDEMMKMGSSVDSLDDGFLTNGHSFKTEAAHELSLSQMERGSEYNLLSRASESEGYEFTPIIKTGVDWRSLITPALLPLTTDFYPDEKRLNSDFKEQIYTLDPLIESPLTPADFFKELVSTRLALGFQLITAKTEIPKDTESKTLTKMSMARRNVTYRLSIGKLFHQIDLQEANITVLVSSPRKNTNLPEVQYKYQFMNPDTDSYSVSFTKFATEPLENYAWNILDNYVINRGFENEGLSDLIQAEKMKYWRSRYCLLPNHPHVKEISDSIRNKEQNSCLKNVDLGCDQFEPISSDQYSNYNEYFMRFMELINSVPKHHRQRSGGQSHSRRSPLMSSAFEKTELNKIELRKLVDTMKDTSNGLSFIDSKNNDLPPATFISYEAIQWMKNTWHNINTADAIDILRKLLKEDFIRHIGENSDMPFLCGFYLYHITSAQSPSPNTLTGPNDDKFWFKREWIEVSLAVNQVSDTVVSPRNIQRQKYHTQSYQRQVSSQSDPSHQQITQPTLPSGVVNKDGYKTADIDTHLNESVKPELRRIEWTSLKYHSVYHPSHAYDFELYWIVATPGLLYEMINTWRRKCNHVDYLLLPIPIDPFALPTEKDSDPLRSPIFIHLAEDFHNRPDVGDFMGYIIKRFGFLPIGFQQDDSIDPFKTEFIHCSGGFFVLMQPPTIKKKPGFHWSWNFMMTKQWCTSGTDNELFQDTMLADFRLLTSNHNDRLSVMWDEWRSFNS